MQHDEKALTRELRRRALNAEFYFADIPKSDGDSLIVLAKKI